MNLELFGHKFDFVAAIEPTRDGNGKVIEYFPQGRYKNNKNLPLHKYGAGPFCELRIPIHLPFEGVYVITLEGRLCYIGECQNLSERFGPRQYGTIHPRNCFQGGQSTNCKLNHLVLLQAKLGHKLSLWFCRWSQRKVLEAEMIRGLQPPWNSQHK